jgi:hypothetical protein
MRLTDAQQEVQRATIVLLLGGAVTRKDEMRAEERRKLPYEFLTVEL